VVALDGQYFPRGHVVQAVAEPLLYIPTPHSTGVVRAAVEHLYPAGHAMHAVEAVLRVVLRYVPMEQAAGAVLALTQ
jgi:hypothetical protein